MRLFHNVRGRIAGLAFSTDGKALFACVRGKWDVAAWNLESGAFRLWDPDVDGPVRSIAASPDGKWLAVGSDVGQVFAYEYPNLEKKEDFSFGGTDRRIHGIAFGWMEDRSDCRIAFAAGTLHVAQMKGTEAADAVSIPHSAVALAFSPDGQFILALDEDCFALQLWNAWTKEPVNHDGFDREPRSVCFTADGRAVAVAVASRVELREVEGLSTRHTLAHGARVTQVAGHPTRNLVASAVTNGTVRFWNADSGTEEKVYNWNIGRVTAVAFAPDGLTCAAGGENGQVVVWDVDA